MTYLYEKPCMIEVAPPTLTTEEQAIVNQHHRQLLAQPHGYDSHILAKYHNPDLSLPWQVFPIPYSFARALVAGELPRFNRKLTGLAAGAHVTRRGKMLLAKRAETLEMKPGLWSIAATGGIDAHEVGMLPAAAAREAYEEIGLVTARKQKFLGVYEHDQHEFVWEAIAVTQFEVDGFVPVLETTEVSETRWVKDLREVGETTTTLPPLLAMIQQVGL